jgi:TRAP-type C4-dicarboxylate transport system permease large subunit
LGVIAALLLAAGYRQIRPSIIREVVEGTMRTTAMILIILLAASFVNFVFATLGLVSKLSNFLDALGLTAFQTLLVIMVLYVILGFFIETLSLMVITVPTVAPIIISLGYDGVWFGILLILLIEMALITPPVGVNLYVVQGVRETGAISDVMIGSIPFVVIISVMAAILVAFPNLALFLPRIMV